MPALEPLGGVRVVADPRSIDRATWAGDDVMVLRLAPDDAFGWGATSVDIDDKHAIVEAEAAFAGAWIDLDEVEPHIEWPLPTERPALAQGSIAGVPAKLRLVGATDALLFTTAAYAHELESRLGWRS